MAAKLQVAPARSPRVCLGRTLPWPRSARSALKGAASTQVLRLT
eukprot:CAMPEP_0170429780 /NCGR_PEP_ID=MMETSP0117_2-20130122/40497_1 /TAXON_ID=400756 /ORGANISM="Durinskia baltica, Strain CSIRO CS-38" /LENGTH=43 /DNA_ID= /DNA_START= /DNA_END= /DNA_ORIENTATION=